MKIFRTRILSETAINCGIVMLMTVGIFCVVKFLALLRRAVQGNLPVDGLGLILTFKLATFLDVILTPAIFIAIMLMLMRWIRDNEMTVFAASGIGPLDYLLSAGSVAGASALIVAFLSLFVAPLAEFGYHHELEKFRLTTKSAPFKKGEFRKIEPGDNVLYYSQVPIDEHDPVRLFYLRTDDTRQSITVANSGKYEFNLNNLVESIEIFDGAQYWIDLDSLDFREMEFESILDQTPAAEFSGRPTNFKAIPTLDLLGSDDLNDIAEFNWRVSKILSATLVVLLAFAWGTAASGTKLGINLVGALIVYFVYSSLLGFITDLVRKQDISSGWISTLPHLVMIALIVLIYLRSYSNRSSGIFVGTRRT